MSLTKNGCVRCDWCGKLSRNDIGEYVRPDGSAAYIHQPDWEHGERDTGRDICAECAAGKCPSCGSSAIVHTHPSTPGPTGWGGRCKDCLFQWTMPVTDLPERE